MLRLSLFLMLVVVSGSGAALAADVDFTKMEQPAAASNNDDFSRASGDVAGGSAGASSGTATPRGADGGVYGDHTASPSAQVVGNLSDDASTAATRGISNSLVIDDYRSKLFIGIAVAVVLGGVLLLIGSLQRSQSETRAAPGRTPPHSPQRANLPRLQTTAPSETAPQVRTDGSAAYERFLAQAGNLNTPRPATKSPMARLLAFADKSPHDATR